MKAQIDCSTKPVLAIFTQINGHFDLNRYYRHFCDYSVIVMSPCLIDWKLRLRMILKAKNEIRYSTVYTFQCNKCLQKSVSLGLIEIILMITMMIMMMMMKKKNYDINVCARNADELFSCTSIRVCIAQPFLAQTCSRLTNESFQPAISCYCLFFCCVFFSSYNANAFQVKLTVAKYIDIEAKFINKIKCIFYSSSKGKCTLWNYWWPRKPVADVFVSRFQTRYSNDCC